MEFNATFLISAVSFAVFVFVMNAILYAPLEKIVEVRKKIIDDNYDVAKMNNERSSALLQDRADKLLKASQDAKTHLLSKTEKIKLKKEEMLNSVRDKSLENLSTAKSELSSAKSDANEVLKKDVVILAQSISDKFLGTEQKILDVDYDLIDEIMQES